MCFVVVVVVFFCFFLFVFLFCFFLVLFLIFFYLLVLFGLLQFFSFEENSVLINQMYKVAP